MTYCTVCRRHVNGVKFVAAPKCSMKRKLWEDSLECKLGDHSKICETHFREAQWKSSTTKRRRLKEDAVPLREPKLTKLGYANSGTQTEEEIIESTMRKENNRLKKMNRQMEKEIQFLRQELEEHTQLDMSLSKIFTETQIKILKNGGKRTQFTSTDISAAICLHTAGPRAYKHLYKKGFPLPSRTTLYRWLGENPVEADKLDVAIELTDDED